MQEIEIQKYWNYKPKIILSNYLNHKIMEF
jgi:hypothetical protein